MHPSSDQPTSRPGSGTVHETMDALSSPSGEFLVVAEDGYVDLWLVVPERLTVTAYALVREGYKSWWIYGPAGEVRRIEALVPIRPVGRLARVLAYTVYNPRLETTVTYAPPRAYALQDLKAALRRAVDKDDDVLTQFCEPDELRRQIDAASTYAELVNVVRGTMSPPDPD